MYRDLWPRCSCRPLLQDPALPAMRTTETLECKEFQPNNEKSKNRTTEIHLFLTRSQALPASLHQSTWRANAHEVTHSDTHYIGPRSTTEPTRAHQETESTPDPSGTHTNAPNFFVRGHPLQVNFVMEQHSKRQSIGNLFCPLRTPCDSKIFLCACRLRRCSFCTEAVAIVKDS